MLDRKVTPTIEEAVHFDLQLKNCDRFTLDNKVPVYAMNAGAQDVVMVEWVFDAGSYHQFFNQKRHNHKNGLSNQ
jgi:hypothetical protein